MSTESAAWGPDQLERYLHHAQIPATLLRNLGETPTVPAAAAALGIGVERIVKTLLFAVERPAGEELVVVISHGEKRVDKKALAALLGVGKHRIGLATPAVVQATLGYAAGGVPPFGHRTALPVWLDAAILPLADSEDGIIYGGGGDDQTMLRLTVAELLRATNPAVAAL